MRTATVILRAETPVALRSGRDQDSAATLDYLPGSALRGALAAAWGMLKGDQSGRFARLFCGEAVRYGNAYPCNFESRALADDILPVRPMPRTALSCKRRQGFPAPDPDHDPRRPPPHGVRDSLIERILYAESGGDPRMLDSLESCGFREGDGRVREPCPATLESFTGYYRRAWDGMTHGQPDIKRELRTRNGISRSRGAAHEAVLYSREALARDSRFQARVTFDDDEDLFRQLDEALHLDWIRIGNNRSRGFGGLRVEEVIDDTPEEDPTEAARDIGSRITGFNDALRDAATAKGVDLQHADYLPVTLESDVIRMDRWFRFLGRLDGAWLAEDAGIAGAALVTQAAGTQRIHGWNAYWGLPKPDDWAIAKGSVFALGLPRSPDAAALERLRRLEREGIGERRAEGFGRIRFAERFHTEMRNRTETGSGATHES